MRLILPRRGHLRSTAANRAPLLTTNDKKDRLSYEKSDDGAAVDIPLLSLEEGGHLPVCEKQQIGLSILETLSSTSKMRIGTDIMPKEEEGQSNTIVIGKHTNNIIIDANQESKSSSSPSPPSPPTHERNGSHGTTSTATTKVAAHTTGPAPRVNPKEEENLDQLVRFIDNNIMTEGVVETDTTSKCSEKGQQRQEVEPVHADSSPVITSDVGPKAQLKSGCQADEAHCDVADDDFAPAEEKDLDYYFNENLDDVVVSIVDDVSVSISVALSGILSSNTVHDDEESRENEAAAKVPDQKMRKLRAVDEEDADALLTTEIDGSRGIYHDSLGNTEIFHLEASKAPFELSYTSGNTEVSSLVGEEVTLCLDVSSDAYTTHVFLFFICPYISIAHSCPAEKRGQILAFSYFQRHQ